jgi:hypothetical protein
MKKALTYKTSLRVTLGNQFVAWARTDASVNVAKDVVSITPNHDAQMKRLMLGEIEAIDESAPTTEFFMNGKPAKDGTVPFLGYLDTKTPAHASVLVKLLPKMAFADHTKADAA